MAILETWELMSYVVTVIGLPLAIGGLFTVSAGVTLAHQLPERTMKTAFAWMIMLTALWLLVKPISLG